MKWFYNMKISLKLILGFIIVALITAIVGSFASLEMNTMKNNDTAVFNENVMALKPIDSINTDFHRVRINLRDHIVADSKDKEKYLTNMNKLYDSIDKGLATYEKSVSSDKERIEYDNLKTSISGYKKEADKIIAVSSANKTEDALKLMQGDIVNYVTSFDASTAKIFQLNFDQAQEKFNYNASAADRNTILIIIISIISIIVAIGFGGFMSKIISNPIKKLEEAADKLAIGDVNVDIKSDTKDEIGKLMKSFGEMVLTIKEQAKVAERIAVGDLSVNLKVKSENDILSKNLNSMIDNIKFLVEDADMLSKAAIEGNLSVRADANKHQGEYRKIVEGVNNTLNAVIEPLDEANQVLYRISLNDLTIKMTGKYNGVLKDFAESINNVHTSLVGIQEIFVDMSKGNISRLGEYERVGKRSENDRMLPAIIIAITSIKNLIEEVRKLSNFAVNGELSARGNAEKFEGGYKEIVEGMNNTIDAMVKPIQEASVVLHYIFLSFL